MSRQLCDKPGCNNPAATLEESGFRCEHHASHGSVITR